MISRDNADAAAKRRNGRSRLTCDSAGSGKVQRDHEGGSYVNKQSLGPFEVSDYDDPVTIRTRKYATGTHVLLEEIRSISA